MHSVVRTVKAGGAPLSKAFHTSAVTTSSSHTTTALLLLQPSKALATLSSRSRSRPVTKLASHYFSTATTATGQAKFVMPMAHSTRNLWTRRFYNTKSYSTSTTRGSSSASATVQELEQLLAKNDYKGFQEACTLATTGSSSAVGTAPMTKELYHFLLKTLGERPQAFASVTVTAGQEGTEENLVDPLNSAIGILTDMSREANVLGKAEVQPDRETLRLVLQVAGGGSGDWESARMLVEAVRHGRLPAVLSLDQWELPDLDIPLDQVLWKSMFECIHSAAAGAGTGTGVQGEVDVMNFLMADQLTRSQDVEMDEALWGYAYGKAGSAAKLNDLLPRLPTIDKTSGGKLYSTVAEALANCGLTGQAAEIMNTLSKTLDTLPSIRPFTALARQHAKRGNYEAIIADEKLWATKGQRDDPMEENRVALLADLHRSSLEASAVALDRLVKTISRAYKDRQSDTLPDQVLVGMAAPTQLNRYQYSEATFLWTRSQDAVAAIPKSDLTAEDYDQLMRISTRLNLLLPKRCSLQDHALNLLTEMKQQGLKPLKSTYLTLMETMARTREYGASREDGLVTQRVMKVFEEMTGQAGYAAESPKDFLPLLESCFGMYSHSPFVAGQWMYSNQLYPASMDALKTVEEMMRKNLSSSITATSTTQEDNSNKDSGSGVNVQQYHDRDTIANVLAGLAHGDQVEEIWERWDDLALQGVERDAMLYQTVIGASHGQEKMARYVLRKVRYDMLREQPAIAMTPEIFEGLLNCCVRVQDATSARSLISQCTASGEIQKTAEWYAPMVRTCLMVEGMEEEGGFLLEEMRRNEMAMDSNGSGAFLEFLMGYFVNKRGDYAAGQEVFKSYLKSEQAKVEKLVAESKAQRAKGNNKYLHNKGGVVEVSEKELVWRSEKWLRPVEHLVERVDLSPTTASMLNLLVLAHIRERAHMLELEKRSGFGAGSKDRMRDAQIVMHYLTGETKPTSLAKPTIPDASTESSSSSPSLLFNSSTTATSPSTFQTSSSSSPMAADKTGRLLFINKYVLGEYIDTCIRDGSEDLLKEADWALYKVMPRVIGQQRMAKDTQRLRQALENARNRGV
ncbi:hypothetical protein BG015_003379 [Linnemannia schmuckeri]|uniref:Uncharacterized protein n=1 Tax=Linnemannia schmuckeri TaxID=64567 RepID=A0A9P5S2U4_9FUNG|nr:hypothetical protein BG015_003379 [Linnemannia schmuckeri]